MIGETHYDTNKPTRAPPHRFGPGRQQPHLGAGSSERAPQFSDRGALAASAGCALTKTVVMVQLFGRDTTGCAFGLCFLADRALIIRFQRGAVGKGRNHPPSSTILHSDALRRIRIKLYKFKLDLAFGQVAGVTGVQCGEE